MISGCLHSVYSSTILNNDADLIDNMGHAGVRAQVATIEQASAASAQTVEAPVVVVTGASRGIGKAIALALGKAGCKVSSLSFPYNDFWNSGWRLTTRYHICCFLLT